MRLPRVNINKLRLIWPHLRPYRLYAILAMVSTTPIGAMDAAIAWMLRPFMDGLSAGTSSVSFFFPLLIILFTVCQGGFRVLSTYLSTWVGMRFAIDVKTEMFKKLIHSEASYFDKMSSGQVIVQYNNDVDIACSSLINNVKTFVIRITSSLSLLVVMFMNSWLLSSISLVIFLIAVFPLARIRKQVRQIKNERFQMENSVFNHFNEAYSGNRVVSVYNLYEHATGKLIKTLFAQMRIRLSLTTRSGGLSMFMHFMVSLGIASAIWLQGYLISTNRLTPGNFVSFFTALIMLYTPIKNMGATVHSISISTQSLDRVLNSLDRQPAITNRPNAVPLEGFQQSICYQDVCFSYVQGKEVLHNINLEIRKGQTIAFVGSSGGGKTTMTTSLLPRLYDVTSGQISIDGIDIRDYDLDSLRDAMSFVFQDNFLFSGTIRENILIGKPDATQEQIDAAVKAACLEDMVRSYETGLDTLIGERGVLLSGGQRQRIAIARAFVKDAPIVILDEATSALDNKSEAVVQAALTNLMVDKTVLVIAHRLSTVMNADRIIVVENGRIAESGSHAELISNTKSIYSGLYHRNFENAAG